MMSQVPSEGINVHGMVRRSPTAPPVTVPLVSACYREAISTTEPILSALSAQKCNFKESISWERCLAVTSTVQAASVGLTLQQKAPI